MNATLKKYVLGCAAILALLICALYHDVLHHEYVWDDNFYLIEYKHYLGADGLKKAITTPFFLSNSYYRPLVVLSLLAIPPGASGSVMVHHGINVIIHIINTLIVFFIARSMLPESAKDRYSGLVCPVLGALFFAAHPLAVEAVAWVSGRYDLLMTTFILLTIKSIQTIKAGVGRYLAIFICFSMALFSKESAVGLFVALPFMIIFMNRNRESDNVSAREVASIILVMLCACVLYLVARISVIGEVLSSKADVTYNGNYLGKINAAAVAIVEFVKLIINPWSNSLPLHPLTNGIGDGSLEVQTIYVLLSLAALIILSKKLDFPLILLSGLGMVWPALHLFGIPNGENIISDRYALAPLAVMMSMIPAYAINCIQYMKKRKLIMNVMMLTIIGWVLGLAMHTLATIPLWKNESVFWEFAYKSAPQSVIATGNYMQTLMVQDRWTEANDILEKLVKRPGVKLTLAMLTNWMTIRAKMGDYDDAIKVFNMFNPAEAGNTNAVDIATFYCARGVLEGWENHWEQAEFYMRKGLEISNMNIKCNISYIDALHKTGKMDQSKKYLESFLQDMPADTVKQIRENSSLAW